MIARRRSAVKASASSHETLRKDPLSRMSGSVSLSARPTKSIPNLPFTHRRAVVGSRAGLAGHPARCGWSAIDIQIDLAADSAVGTGGADASARSFGFPFPRADFSWSAACRARADALAAQLARGLLEGAVEARRHLDLAPAGLQRQRLDPLDFLADPHAALAADALGRVVADGQAFVEV